MVAKGDSRHFLAAHGLVVLGLGNVRYVAIPRPTQTSASPTSHQ